MHDFPTNLVLATVAYSASVLVIEGVRRGRPTRPPWWVAHVNHVPWGLLVLLPWVYWTLAPGEWWAVNAARHTLADLPLSTPYHLGALAGFTLGVIVAMLAQSRMSPRFDGTLSVPTIRWHIVAVSVFGALALYVLAFLVADRPLASMWRLGGEFLYGVESGTETAPLYLEFALLSAVSVLLVATAARRARLRNPRPLEVVLLSVLSLTLLGRGARNWLYLLVLGWVILQVIPYLHPERNRARTAVVMALLCLGLIGGVGYATTVLAQVRVGQSAEGLDPIREAVRSVDVIGSTEVLLQRLGSDTILGGESYRELPFLFVPRRLYPDKPHPSADSLMRSYLGETSGYSSPWWMEPALNYGLIGALAGSALYAWLIGALLLLLLRARRPSLRMTPTLVGPLLPIFNYQLMARLTTFQLVITAGAFAIGLCWFAVTHRGSFTLPLHQSVR